MQMFANFAISCGIHWRPLFSAVPSQINFHLIHIFQNIIMEDFYFPQYHLPLLLLSIQLRKHGCLLFFKFTLASDVLLAQELSVSIIARFLHLGKTFAKKIWKIHMYRNTVLPQLICHNGREEQDKWTCGKKRSTLEEWQSTMWNEQATQWLHHFWKQNWHSSNTIWETHDWSEPPDAR